MPPRLVIGTRGSQLALWQANWVKAELERAHPGLSCSLEIIKTSGDKILDVPLAQVGGKGLFVKEIEEALLNGTVDLAVHSMKDMPALIPDGLGIGAVTRREAANDVLISRAGNTLMEMPENARIGTSSLRRASQLLHRRPDFQIIPLRGNIDTRLKKLQTQDMHAIVLAAAGILRLDFAGHITEYIDTDVLIPAVGQGALCIETRSNDPSVIERLSVLNHDETRSAVLAERAFLKRLEGGCQVPVAAYGTVQDGLLHISGMVAETDGSLMYRQSLNGPVSQAEALGLALAEDLIGQGAQAILDRLCQESKKP